MFTVKRKLRFVNYRLFGTKRKVIECKMIQGYLWYSFIDLHQICACPHKSSENCCLFEVTRALKENLTKPQFTIGFNIKLLRIPLRNCNLLKIFSLMLASCY